ncbi:hypothetical protein BG000_007031 [Podila horticola]|nr:hypothetical protein BG000_007031 [Podila horticola]
MDGRREPWHVPGESYRFKMQIRQLFLDSEFQRHKEENRGVPTMERYMTQGQRENMVLGIEEAVKQHPILKPRLKAVLGHIKEVELKKRQEQVTQKHLQAAQ